MKVTPFSLLLFLLFIAACSKSSSEENKKQEEINYRQEMRDFVVHISETAKARNNNFIIIPQNGIELISTNGNLNTSYINAIDGHGQENLFYGYTGDDQETTTATSTKLRSFIDLLKNEGKTILVTDYCTTPSKIEDSYQKNNAANYISFAADDRGLAKIPTNPVNPFNENNTAITQLNQITNFLYLINPQNYTSKATFLSALAATNYDLILIDLFYSDGSTFTENEINALKTKANGGTRLVISYMSIGEAEDYRYYWNSDWSTNVPNWLDAENPNWPGNFKVTYWDSEWQKIIVGDNNSYLSSILNAGFDGVYLDIIDAYEFYENK